MPDVPFTTEVMPPHGTTGWDVPLNDNLVSIAARLNVHESALGIFLDSMSGVSDDAKLVQAMAIASAATYAPAIILSNRVHTFSGGPYPLYNGLRMVGAPLTTEREFLTTGPQCVVNVGSTSLFTVPSGGVQTVWFSGIQFRASSGTVNWLTPVSDLGGGPIMTDVSFERLAWFGFKSVMQARHLRVQIEHTYVNGGTGTQFQLAGSDNTYWSKGYSYLSSNTVPASAYFLYLVNMSRTRVGAVYITPRVATGIRIDGGFGDLQFSGTLLDGTAGTTTTGCQGAAILITGGEGYVFDKVWCFNNAVNPAGTGRSPQDKGQVYIKAGANMLFHGCAFLGGTKQTLVTPSGTPQIYAASGVTGVRVSNPLAPYGGVKLLQNAVSGAISCDDSSWSVAVA